MKRLLGNPPLYHYQSLLINTGITCLLQTPLEIHDFISVSPKQGSVTGHLGDMGIIFHAFGSTGKLEKNHTQRVVQYI